MTATRRVARPHTAPATMTQKKTTPLSLHQSSLKVETRIGHFTGSTKCQVALQMTRATNKDGFHIFRSAATWPVLCCSWLLGEAVPCRLGPQRVLRWPPPHGEPAAAAQPDSSGFYQKPVQTTRSACTADRLAQIPPPTLISTQLRWRQYLPTQTICYSPRATAASKRSSSVSGRKPLDPRARSYWFPTNPLVHET